MWQFTGDVFCCIFAKKVAIQSTLERLMLSCIDEGRGDISVMMLTKRLCLKTVSVRSKFSSFTDAIVV